LARFFGEYFWQNLFALWQNLLARDTKNLALHFWSAKFMNKKIGKALICRSTGKTLPK
jgi:hypothetical protein